MIMEGQTILMPQNWNVVFTRITGSLTKEIRTVFFSVKKSISSNMLTFMKML
jgi:hypothetical protein